MKTLLLLVLAALSGVCIATSETLTNRTSEIDTKLWPVLSEVIFTQAGKGTASWTNSVIFTEGGWSGKGSSINNTRDYFVVTLPNSPQRARILERQLYKNIVVFGGTSKRGITDSEIRFRDVVTDEIFTFPLRATGTMIFPSPLDAFGAVSTMSQEFEGTVDGTTIYGKIRYMGHPNYPVIQLTWGEGANIGLSGNETDFVTLDGVTHLLEKTPFEMLQRDAKSFEIRGFINSQGSFRLQSSLDFTQWRNRSAVFTQDSLNGFMVFKSTFDEKGTNEFFRLITIQ